MYFSRSWPACRSNVAASILRSTKKSGSSESLVNFCHTTRRHIPESVIFILTAVRILDLTGPITFYVTHSFSLVNFCLLSDLMNFFYVQQLFHFIKRR